MLARGDVLAGEYAIDALVGKGGMGCVYRAHRCQNPHEAVAIKELPSQLRLSSGQFVHQGASSQMKLMKRVDHADIAKLLDAFCCAGATYMVFEFVEGRSLQSIVATSGALPEEQVLGWALQLCDILGYLHALEPPVVYRDMKPSNVLLDKAGALKLVDLGIAREFKSGSDQEKDTAAFGTQGYAPPEQYGCAQTDARADIYALGCTLWHLLSGFPPPMEFPLPSVRSANPQISVACDKLVARCTQLDRSKRYQSCQELARDIQRLLSGCAGGADGSDAGVDDCGAAGDASDAIGGDTAAGADAPGATSAGETCNCAASTARAVSVAHAASTVHAASDAGLFEPSDEDTKGKKGPADRLARVFGRLLKPWPHVEARQQRTSDDLCASAPYCGSKDDCSHKDAEGATCAANSDTPDAATGAASGDAVASAGAVPADAARSHAARSDAAANGDVARFCFSQAPCLILDDLPTVLLTNSLDIQCRATGELPSLPGAPANGFFFTIVQSELCVHDDCGDVHAAAR